ncbi:MAG TPA: ester cyclase [Bryobacteraceae bacterium]|nr:ester cyclase [Bryobacteraceae bacterium]
MSADTNKAVINRFVQEVINHRNLAAIDELVADDFAEQVPFPGQGPGPEGLQYVVRLFVDAFPDMKWSIEEQIAEGEKVVSRFTWTGTQRGEFLGLAPSGRKVTVWGIVIDVVRGGKLSASRILMDAAGLMQQLGAGPA